MRRGRGWCRGPAGGDNQWSVGAKASEAGERQEQDLARVEQAYLQEAAVAAVDLALLVARHLGELLVHVDEREPGDRRIRDAQSDRQRLRQDGEASEPACAVSGRAVCTELCAAATLEGGRRLHTLEKSVVPLIEHSRARGGRQPAVKARAWRGELADCVVEGALAAVWRRRLLLCLRLILDRRQRAHR